MPALTALAHSKNRMLIVVDVEGHGSSEALSLGLSAEADYVLRVKLEGNQDAPTVGPSQSGSLVTISNVRGKQYAQRTWRVTVNPGPHTNELVVDEGTATA
jgi:hypothetical protein